MNEEEAAEIQLAFNDVSESLKKLERLIKQHHDTPSSNLNRKDFTKVKIAPNYIRTVEDFRIRYNLYKIIEDKCVRDNVAYALAYSDFLNYLINRFHTWGYVENLLLKSSIINLACIHEGLIISALKKLRSFCIINGVLCKYSSSCDYYVKNVKSLPYAKALELFNERVGFKDQTTYQSLNEINDLRNNIHLSLTVENELSTTIYSIEKYNQALNLLLYLQTKLSEHMIDFHSRRYNKCTHPTYSLKRDFLGMDNNLF